MRGERGRDVASSSECATRVCSSAGGTSRCSQSSTSACGRAVAYLPVSPRISPHLPVSAQRRVVAAYGGDPPTHTQAWRVRLLCP